jgi:hypothetical protein
MSNDTNPNATGHGSYERRDIGIGGVLYFIAILAVVCIVCGFIVDGLYHYLDKRTEAGQPPISPLLRNAPNDTRKLPAEYKTDSESADYQKYLESNFPAPQLETNERTELNKIRLREDQTLATYDWVDQNAGTVRIPIDRAMELIAQRGLPVRTESGPATQTGKAQPEKTKGTKQ